MQLLSVTGLDALLRVFAGHKGLAGGALVGGHDL